MSSKRFLIAVCLTACLGCLLLSACSPPFNWREYHGDSAPYTVLMPDKPASLSRPVELAGLKLTLTMNAAEVRGISFAVGSLQVDEPGQAGIVMQAMRNGLLANIRSQPAKAQTLADGSLIAHGSTADGRPLKMAARFVSHGNWVYQVVAIGPEQALTQELSDSFLGSFHAN